MPESAQQDTKTVMTERDREETRWRKATALNAAIALNDGSNGSIDPADITRAARAFERFLKVD